MSEDGFRVFESKTANGLGVQAVRGGALKVLLECTIWHLWFVHDFVLCSFRVLGVSVQYLDPPFLCIHRLTPVTLSSRARRAPVEGTSSLQKPRRRLLLSLRLHVGTDLVQPNLSPTLHELRHCASKQS